MSNRDETTAQMKTRMNVWVLGAMMVLALAVIINLFKVSIIQNKEYQEMANNNHFGKPGLDLRRKRQDPCPECYSLQDLH